MHEFGHAFGLGHASYPDTANGPELMYPISTVTQTIYPSTLDVYGLLMLYTDKFGQTIQLPSTIPYIMLAEGRVFTPEPNHPLNIPYILFNELKALLTISPEILSQPMILIVSSILWISIALLLGLLFRSESKATLATLTILILANLPALSNSRLPLSALEIFFLLPAILIGASIGRFIRQKIARRKTETMNFKSN